MEKLSTPATARPCLRCLRLPRPCLHRLCLSRPGLCPSWLRARTCHQECKVPHGLRAPQSGTAPPRLPRPRGFQNCVAVFQFRLPNPRPTGFGLKPRLRYSPVALRSPTPPHHFSARYFEHRLCWLRFCPSRHRARAQWCLCCRCRRHRHVAAPRRLPRLQQALFHLRGRTTGRHRPAQFRRPRWLPWYPALPVRPPWAPRDWRCRCPRPRCPPRPSNDARGWGRCKEGSRTAAGLPLMNRGIQGTPAAQAVGFAGFVGIPMVEIGKAGKVGLANLPRSIPFHTILGKAATFPALNPGKAAGSPVRNPGKAAGSPLSNPGKVVGLPSAHLGELLALPCLTSSRRCGTCWLLASRRTHWLLASR